MATDLSFASGGNHICHLEKRINLNYSIFLLFEYINPISVGTWTARDRDRPDQLCSQILNSVVLQKWTWKSGLCEHVSSCIASQSVRLQPTLNRIQGLKIVRKTKLRMKN